MPEKVTIAEALDKIMAVNGPLCSANKEMLERLIPFHGIETICSAKVTGYADGNLTMEVGGGTKSVHADSVVLCVGHYSESQTAT